MKKDHALGLGMLLLSILLITAAVECRLAVQRMKTAVEIQRIEELETEIHGLKNQLDDLDSRAGMKLLQRLLEIRRTAEIQ